MNWNEKKSIQKGVFGFLSLDESEQRTITIRFVVNSQQSELIKKFAKKLGVPVSGMVRSAISSMMEYSGFLSVEQVKEPPGFDIVRNSLSHYLKGQDQEARENTVYALKRLIWSLEMENSEGK